MATETEMASIRQALAGLCRADYSNDETVRRLMRNVSKGSLAEFLIDAFDRGWISRFNLGIDDDGNVI